MREFKFRAWDNENKKMYYFNLFHYMQTIEYSQNELCPPFSEILDTLMQ